MSTAADNAAVQSEELEALEAIYGQELTLHPNLGSVSVTIRVTPGVKIRATLPLAYPTEPPVLELFGADGALIAAVLESFVPGEQFLFSAVELVRDLLPPVEVEVAQPPLSTDTAVSPAAVGERDASKQLHVHHGEPRTHLKSTFQAHCARCRSKNDVAEFRSQLLSIPKVGRATHNITAFRFTDPATGRLISDCDDDGESAAGSKLAQLLDVMRAMDVCVVVSRWYGGVHLGPTRFKMINEAAREVLQRHGFGERQESRCTGSKR